MSKNPINNNLTQRILYDAGEHRVGEAARFMPDHEVRRQGGRQVLRRTGQALMLAAGLTAASVAMHTNLKEATDRGAESHPITGQDEVSASDGTDSKTAPTTTQHNSQTPPEDAAQNNGE